MDYVLWQLPFAAGVQLIDVWASRSGAKLAWKIDIDTALDNANADHQV
jgi:predicted nicotinamide N-methyase